MIMEFGAYPQWEIKNINSAESDKYLKIGMKDVAYIYEGEEKKHAYIDWKEHKEDVYYFESTPIKWRILEETPDRILVLSEYNIDCKQYNESDVNVTWETSTIRKWLNLQFINKAFNEKERLCILDTENVNEYNPIRFVDGGQNTLDKIFLLSLRDVLNVNYGFEGYLAQSETREARNTDYTRIMGALTNPEKGMGWWWLRTPGESNTWSSRIDYSGYVYDCGKPVTMHGGVRPAMYLDKAKLQEFGIR